MNKNDAILLSYTTGRLERILVIHLTTAHFRPGEWLSPTNPTVAKANPWLTPSPQVDWRTKCPSWLGRELHGAYHVIIGSKCLVKTNTDRSSIFVLHLMWPRRTLRTLRKIQNDRLTTNQIKMCQGSWSTVTSNLSMRTLAAGRTRSSLLAQLFWFHGGMVGNANKILQVSWEQPLKSHNTPQCLKSPIINMSLSSVYA